MKRYYSLMILVLLCSHITHAENIDPGLPGGDPDVPLDGGVGILLLAGTIYGIKKINQLKQ